MIVLIDVIKRIIGYVSHILSHAVFWLIVHTSFTLLATLWLAGQMSRVLAGEFSDVIERVVIVDCRYPYEFSAGHIAVSGAFLL